MEIVPGMVFTINKSFAPFDGLVEIVEIDLFSDLLRVQILNGKEYHGTLWYIEKDWLDEV